MGEVKEEKPGLDPVQKNELEQMGSDFEPVPEPIAGEAVSGQASIDSAQMCGTCFSVVFGIIAGRRGSHWALSGEEVEQLGQATGAVLDKYCPDVEGGPEYALVLAAAMVVLPRVMLDRQAANDSSVEDNDDGSKAKAMFAE